MSYYDGTRLLSQRDINGDLPEIYISTSNRSAGKTTWFSRYLVNKFLKAREKFGLLYRFDYELDDVADKFFKDIQGLFFPDHELIAKKKARGMYAELFMDGYSCGYALALNKADAIKKNSHLFSDIDRLYMDEFQSETNHYCNNEVQKLISVHTSIARGANKQVRRVPVILVGNPVSIINPYYVELGISDRIRPDTRFLRGEGFVLEQGFNEAAATAQSESAFNRAFSANKYAAYAAQAKYLNDNQAFIAKPEGTGRYLCTLRYLGEDYGIREYADEGIIYCDDHPDLTHPRRISVTTEDHEINYVMLARNDFFIMTLRQLFEHGSFRFKNLRCKDAVLKALSY